MIAAAMDPFILRQAEICASRMVGNYGFATDEWDDLRQELVLDYLERLPRFDPNRGDLRGFGYGVVRNHASKIARRRRLLPCPEPAAPSTEPNGQLDLQIDVKTVVSKLPLHLQCLAWQLSEMSLAEVCQQTGKSRSRIHQLIRQIRSAFVEAGITPKDTWRRGGR